MKRIGLILVALGLLGTSAKAADERAKRDINGNPALLGESSTTGELRKIHTDDDGNIVVISSGTSSISGSIDQGAAGAQEWLTKISSGTSAVTMEEQAWTTPRVSTVSVSNVSATLVLPSDSSRIDAMVCNEDTAAMRVGPSSVSGTVGLRLLGDTCLPLSTATRKPQGELYMISLGVSAGQVSVLEVLP